MSRSGPVTFDPAVRNALAIADAEDVRSVIVSALAAVPVDEQALRRGVWTFVGTERDAGAAPGEVIIALTGLVDQAKLAPLPVYQSRLRRVILWCVEAYFGHLGGDGVGPETNAFASLPRPSSNR